ncbi:putative lipase atg15, partial [Irineochytrium annulatum]
MRWLLVLLTLLLPAAHATPDYPAALRRSHDVQLRHAFRMGLLRGNDGTAGPFFERADFHAAAEGGYRESEWMKDEDEVGRGTVEKREGLPHGNRFRLRSRVGSVDERRRAKMGLHMQQDEEDDLTMSYGEMTMPDEEDVYTVLALGEMSYVSKELALFKANCFYVQRTQNAYYNPTDKEWRPVDGWSPRDAFGSSKSAIRGHVYASEEEDIVVIVIKGTSLQTPVSGSPTGALDKLNELNYKESYYRFSTTIATTVQHMFPRSSIWLAGHSLGGALASLTGLTFGLPAFSYEAPGDRLFAKRLGLIPDAPPNVDETIWEGQFMATLPIFSFGNDGDPIFLGECLKASSYGCYWSGYALETRCHIGRECMYERHLDGKLPPSGVPQSSLSLSVKASDPTITNHGIEYVIKTFLS